MAPDKQAKRTFRPLRIAVLTVSDTRTEATDTSGALLVDRLQAAGHQLAEKAIEPDDIYRIRATVSRWIAAPDINVVITTGGTGVTGRVYHNGELVDSQVISGTSTTFTTKTVVVNGVAVGDAIIPIHEQQEVADGVVQKRE